MVGFGVIGAVIGALISYKLNTTILKKCFGVFLAVIAIHEIYTILKSNKKEKNTHNKIKLKWKEMILWNLLKVL